MAPSAESRRRTLGDFLRAHRDRLTPASLGLPTGARRRTPGLRREEVAQVAGISATWYAWLEQGRDVAASPAALAAALRLTPAERAYLFELAERRDPATPAPADTMDVPPAVAAALASIA